MHKLVQTNSASFCFIPQYTLNIGTICCPSHTRIMFYFSLFSDSSYSSLHNVEELSNLPKANIFFHTAPQEIFEGVRTGDQGYHEEDSPCRALPSVNTNSRILSSYSCVLAVRLVRLQVTGSSTITSTLH